MEQPTNSTPIPETANIPTEQEALPTPKRFQLSKRVIILMSILLVVLVGVTSYFIFANKVKESVNPPQTSSNQLITSPTATSTVAKTNLTETKSIDVLNPSALIKVPFVRDGNIYLYEDGKEKLVAKPAQNTTQQACYNLVYPFLSPNSKYLAYIEQIGEQPGYGGCLGGFLRIVDTSTGVNKPTSYKTSYFSWTPQNQLELTPELENIGLGQKRIIKQVFYNPADNKETTYQSIIDVASNGAETLLVADYPSFGDSLIRFKDNKYYLASKTTNKEVLLLDKTQVASFLDWSPDGKYAIFESVKKPTEAFDAIELVVDIQNPTATPKEIMVGRGGAGGDFSTGRKWYFEKGFVAYCRQDLYFVDGSQPLELTNDGGGGCHNEDGFVATSPSGEYAFVKFKDKFEVHTKDGAKTVIKETTPLAKGRGMPKNLIWLNDDYMVIFERTYNGNYGTDDKPRVYLFDRRANIIKPLIENAYLIETLPY